MVNLTPSHPSWKRRMFAPLWTFHDPLKMSKGVPSVRCQPLGPLGGIPTGASEPQPWGGKLGGGGSQCPPLRLRPWCSPPACSLFSSKVKSADGEGGNKMEEKLFWVFSGSSSGPVLFFLSILSAPQTFLLSGMCFREASGHQTFWICFRLVPFSHHPWSCPCFHL